MLFTSLTSFNVNARSHLALSCVPLCSGYWHTVLPLQWTPRLPRCLEHTSMFSSCEVATFRNSARSKIKSYSERLSLDKWYRLRWAETSWLQLLRRSRLSWPINSPHPAPSFNNMKQDILPRLFVYQIKLKDGVGGSRPSEKRCDSPPLSLAYCYVFPHVL